MNLRKVTMTYGFLVCIRHDSAEIWEFRCGLTLGIGTLKLWPAPVFSCVLVLALKRPISSFQAISSIILT
jgi:hypothetical protein